MRDEQRAHLLAPVFLRERLARRHRLQPEKDVKFVSRIRLELPVPAHYRGGIGEIEDNRSGVQRPHRVGAEQEAGDDAEITTAAAQTPEQIRILVFGRGDEAAVGQHHVGLQQIVRGEPILAAEIAVAPAQREAGNTGRRDDPERHGLPEGAGGVVDIPGDAAAADPRRALRRVNTHALHQ